MRSRVLLESPYAAPTPEGLRRNVAYARLAVRDSVTRGEAPIASHLLFPQPGILRDEDVAEREAGIEAGLAWIGVCLRMVVYSDLGISPGMKRAITLANFYGTAVEYRSGLDLSKLDEEAPPWP